VLRMVLGEVLLLAGAGVAAALPVAWWLAEYARSQLYGIEPRDPATIALAALSLLAVAAAAGALPALKASRQNPLEVLRYE
jgi:macrolide transport system ATP-binding/permease protein